MSVYSFVPAFAVYQTINEYGAIGACVGFYSILTKARNAAVSQGYFGGMGAVREVTLLSCDDRLFLLDSAFPEGIPNEDFDRNLIVSRAEAMKAARAKAAEVLTAAEREILGIKD